MLQLFNKLEFMNYHYDCIFEEIHCDTNCLRLCVYTHPHAFSHTFLLHTYYSPFLEQPLASLEV